MTQEHDKGPEESMTIPGTDLSAGARTLILLSQFDRIRAMANGICLIVPLKGISLLKTLYHKEFDRDTGDIDILIFPPEKAQMFVERLLKAGYRRQFNHLADHDALMAKRKIALRGATPLDTDVDIHLDFITKKFFRHHCGNFNAEALTRCTPDSDGILLMDPVDEWLFLAQHACFHQFGNSKWLRDLSLLYQTFSPTQLSKLKNRKKKYGMRRVTRTCLRELNLVRPFPTTAEKRFDRLTDAILHRRHHRLSDRILGSLWEILMIDSPSGRIAAYCRLLLPKPGEMKAIYRISGLKASLMYPLHLPLGIMAILFLQIYRLRLFLSLSRTAK